LWGRPSPEDIERLVHVLRVELDERRAPHVAVVDARRVEGADPRGFAVMERYVREEHEALGRAVTRLAIVRPDGLLGAITAGFFGVTPPPYPVEVFDDRRRAVEWLGESGAILDDIAAEEQRATGTPPLLRDLRALLEKKLGDDPSLYAVAKALGLSERSLQRKLGEHDTTFQGEVNAVRVRVAKRLLRDTNASLTQIAFDVGCASLASFSALFRRGDRHGAERMAPAEALTVVPGIGTLRSPRHHDLRQKPNGTIAAPCTDMRFSSLGLAFSALLLARPTFAQEEPAPPEEKPTAEPQKPAEAPAAAEMPKADVKTGGLRLGLDLSYARSTGEASDRVSAPLARNDPSRRGRELSNEPEAAPRRARTHRPCVARRLSRRLELHGAHVRARRPLRSRVRLARVLRSMDPLWDRLGDPESARHVQERRRLSLGAGPRSPRPAVRGDFRVSDATRIGPFVGMIAGLGLHEDRAPAAERTLNSGHVWFSIGARGNFDL